jgi:NTP pyrophosphatase (non-canonical NTP hydrolase)
MEFPLYPNDDDEDKLTLSEYHTRSQRRAVYPNVGDNIFYPVLGICGEAGELAEKLKKVLRDKDGRIDAEDRKAMAKELGDVLWYIAAAAGELGFDLAEIARISLEKVDGRHERGTLHGSGDDR